MGFTMNPKKKSSICAKLFKAFRVILVGLFGVQAALLYLAQKDVELPDFVCKWIEENFAPAGTRLEIGGGTLRRLAFLELRKISLSHATANEPTISLHTAGAYFNWKNFLSPNKNVQTFFFDGIELRCPPSLSQTGKSELVLSGGRINAAYSFGEIYLKDAVARIGEIPLYASGIIDFSPFRETPSAPSEEPGVPAPETPHASNALTPIFKFAGTLSNFNRRLTKSDVHKNISVQALIEQTEESEMLVEMELFCEELKCAELNFSVNEFCLHGDFLLDPSMTKIRLAAPLRASAKSLDYAINDDELFNAWHFSAKEAELAAHFAITEDFDVVPGKTAVSVLNAEAENFLQGTFPISPLLAEITLPDLKGESANVVLNAHAFGSDISAEIDFSRAAGTQVILDTEIDVPRLLKIPQISGAVPEDIEKLRFGENPNLRANIALNPEFEFVRADYALDSGATIWDTLKADSVFASGSLTPDAIDIQSVRVGGECYCVASRIFFELKSGGKYRVQVSGSTVNPEILDDYFGWFWWRIWNNLSIPKTGHAPRVDIDVHGTLAPDSKWEYIYGAIAGENAVGGGVLVDKVSLRIAEEPSVISAFDMYFRRGNDHVTGTLQWHYAFEPEYHFRDFRFGFSGSMPPTDVFNIVGEGLPEIFEGVLEREQAGTAVAVGYISGNERFYPEERILVEVDVQSAPGDFRFFGIEGADFVGKINYDSGNVRVAPFSAKYGEGNVSGEILVLFPPESELAGTQITLDLTLESVSVSTLSSTLDKLTALGESGEEKSAPAEETPEKEAIADKTEDSSKVAAHFKGTLTLPDMHSLTATGNFSVNDPELFDLQIFGGFSRFLETLKIPLTSFALTDAHTDFTVENGKAYLPNLKIYGESGELDIQLNADISTKKLQGTAVFKNRRFTQLPLLGKLVDWASETTTLIPIELSGTLDDITWKLKPFSNLNPNKKNHGEAPSSREKRERD